MTRWMNDEPPQHTPPTRSFAADLLSLGPASTMGRELLAASIQVAAVALLIFVVFPHRLPEPWRWLLLAATVVYFILRFAAGIPKWRRR